MSIKSERLTVWVEKMSLTGLLLATLFFAASLTPSLIPRHFALQGVLSGLSSAVGYGIGLLAERTWAYVQLPQPAGRLARRLKQGVGLVCLVVAIVFLWLANGWQNSVRQALDMPLVTSANPFQVALIAFLTFCFLIAIGRLVRFTFRIISRWLKQRMPDRVAYLLGAALAALLFWSVLDGVIFRTALHIADRSYRELDARIESDIAAPVDPGRAKI